MSKQKANYVVDGDNLTAACVANVADEMTRHVSTLVKFARNFWSKQSSFSLRSRSIKDRSGPKAL